LGDPGDSLHLKVEIRKEFKSEYVNDLNESWGVEDVKTLKNEKTILVRKTNNSNEEETAQKGTLSFFLASTYKNAPEYIIFLFRLSISIVLFWFILYGVLFLDKNKGEYKDLLKNDKNKIDD
jgi:hypothetical protein